MSLAGKGCLARVGYLFLIFLAGFLKEQNPRKVKISEKATKNKRKGQQA